MSLFRGLLNPNTHRKLRRTGRAFTGSLTLLVLIFLFPSKEAAIAMSLPQPTLEDVLKMMDTAVQNFRQVTYILTKQERLRPEKDLLPRETALVKYRKPRDIYMKFLDGEHAGREVMYRQGVHNSELLAHESWMFWPLRSVYLSPFDPRAMKVNHHPITEAGLDNSVEIPRFDREKNLKLRDADPNHPAITYDGPKVISDGGEQVYYFKANLPEIWRDYTMTASDKSLFDIATKLKVHVQTLIYYNRHVKNVADVEPGKVIKAPLYTAKGAEFWIFPDSGFVKRIRVWDFKGNIYEEYGHSNVKVDAASGLTEADFDPKNKAYNF